MQTQISTKFVALIVALLINTAMLGSVALLFNGQLHASAARSVNGQVPAPDLLI